MNAYFLCDISDTEDTFHEWMDTSNYIRGLHLHEGKWKIERRAGTGTRNGTEIGICYLPRHIASSEVIYTTSGWRFQANGMKNQESRTLIRRKFVEACTIYHFQLRNSHGHNWKIVANPLSKAIKFKTLPLIARSSCFFIYFGFVFAFYKWKL